MGLGFASGALAQTPPSAYQRAELGGRHWVSTGETKHAHNAQGLVPSLGNPTSVLHYDNLDANSLEVFGRFNFAREWFVKGYVGFGIVNTGSFRDEDFNAGQVKFSDTTSSVTEGWLGYGTVDIGHQWVLKEGAANVGVFLGLMHWTEEVEAFGATATVGSVGNISNSVRVITNNLTWSGLRVGVAGRMNFGRVRVAGDVAVIPYASYRNEDSHHLRTSPSDLGPAPNIVLEGDGRGLQLDAEVGYEITRRMVLALGWRYWYLESTDGKRSLPNFPTFPELPVTELYSKRTGLTASLRYLW